MMSEDMKVNKKYIKKSITAVAALSIFLTLSAAAFADTISYTYSAGEGKTYTREMEKLDRGLVAVKTDGGVFLSWRLFDSEDARFGSAEENVSFNIYRGNQKIGEVSDTTNYTDTTAGTSYSVAPVINGKEGDKCEAVTVMNNSYFDIPLVKPADETIDEGGTPATKSFSPTDCSTGDLDGDGEYEIVVKWVSQEQDVGNGGYSGTVRFAAYKLDGTKLWDNDINLGKNVYSSAHTAQFLVYDFNGDGKAEMMVQTSLGSTDSKGSYVSHSAKADSVVASTNKKIAEYTDEENASADFNGYDRKISGEEFLTVFNGETGEAIDTIDLPTTRGSAKGVDYGDDFGNRSNRFVADVAYLDGEKPYAVYLRGYYFGKNGRQRTSIAGISFDGERLSPDYRFDTKSGQPGYYDGAELYVGQGNHNCTVADVDNDGKDEFITGALCMEVKDDNSFKPRWCTFLEHGDALHIGDYDPTHEGLEFFTVHEDGNDEDQAGPDGIAGTDDDYGYIQSNAKKAGKNVICNFGMSVIDANTGDIIFHKGNTKDTGRGVMANTGSGGYYQITGVGSYQCNGGTNFTSTRNGAGSNFRIFWDGDLYDELLDGTNVTNYNGAGFNAGSYGCVKINGTKSNPALQADLFGDWREELVYPTTDGTNLRVFTTTTPTNYKIKTLMHDPVYRSGVAAEQTAYNQPPHVGMYLSEDLFGAEATNLEIVSAPTKTTYVIGEQLDTSGIVVRATYDDGTRKNIDSYSISGYNPNIAGKQTITVSYMDKTASFEVTVKEIDSIIISSPPKNKNVYMGGSLDTTGLVVKAAYSDGSSSSVTDYTLSYQTETVGETTVTVKYMNKNATFTITVLPASIEALNQTYATDSTESVLTTVSIGSYKDDFTIEHTVKINSMPASAPTSGNNNRNNTNGFFVRFQPEVSDKQGMGGGWVISERNGKANVHWKASSDNLGSSIASLNIGETYTFKYQFTGVGAGSGATVALTITDSAGKTIGTGTELDLRNMTHSTPHLGLALSSVQIYNQAKSGSTANVVFDNARIYSSGEITSVTGNEISVHIASSAGMKLYAAKYNEGTLENVQIFTPENAGGSILKADFEPDKVFLWADMMPIDIWNK